MSYLPGNEAQNRLDRSLALPAAPATSRLTLAALAQFLAALRKTDHRSRTITVEDTVSMRSCAISYRAAQVRSSKRVTSTQARRSRVPWLAYYLQKHGSPTRPACQNYGHLAHNRAEVIHRFDGR